jgi:fructose-bisphosphate aldolase class II/tagatose 1,6-diphosphate aldolase GatY/KbaY
MEQPLILQLTKSSIDYMGLPVAVQMAKSMLAYHGVEGWVHLDHGDSYELVAQCLDAGFDSVMIDASEKPFQENIAITGKVVKLAESYGANVEAELGYIAKLGQDREKGGFTQPLEAKEFVDATGVNALAIAIGTAHGFYDKEPKLQLDRLSEIAAATPVSLVLHGSSGVPGISLRNAVDRGICKVNLATEIKNIFMQTLKEKLLTNEEIDLRKVFPVATDEIVALVKEKLDIVRNLK